MRYKIPKGTTLVVDKALKKEAARCLDLDTARELADLLNVRAIAKSYRQEKEDRDIRAMVLAREIGGAL